MAPARRRLLVADHDDGVRVAVNDIVSFATRHDGRQQQAAGSRQRQTRRSIPGRADTVTVPSDAV
jgi:hypothetical protein